MNTGIDAFWSMYTEMNAMDSETNARLSINTKMNAVRSVNTETNAL